MTMTNYFTKAELHGARINEVSQVGIILNSLSTNFIQFTSNYIMNKLRYDLTQLLNEFQTFESISKLGLSMSSLNLTEKTSPSKRKGRSLKKKVKIAAKGKGGGQAGPSKEKNPALEVNKPAFKKSGKVSKPKVIKGKCFHCQEVGHWKRNCPKFLAEKKGEGNSLFPEIHVLEMNYVDNSNFSWIVDSGATDHVCSSL